MCKTQIPTATVTAISSIRKKSNGRLAPRNEKRIVMHFNESTKQLIGMNEIVFNARKMEIHRPGIDSTNSISFLSHNCNLRLEHESLIGNYTVVRENEDVLKLIKLEE